MKRIYKTKSMWLVLLIPLVVSIITPGTVKAVETEVISVGPINTTFALMNKGQSKTYTVKSDLYPDLMIIYFVVNGSGSMRINVTKNDTTKTPNPKSAIIQTPSSKNPKALQEF